MGCQVSSLEVLFKQSQFLGCLRDVYTSLIADLSEAMHFGSNGREVRHIADTMGEISFELMRRCRQVAETLKGLNKVAEYPIAAILGIDFHFRHDSLVAYGLANSLDGEFCLAHQAAYHLPHQARIALDGVFFTNSMLITLDRAIYDLKDLAHLRRRVSVGHQEADQLPPVAQRRVLTLKKAADLAIGAAMHEFGGRIPRIQIATRAGVMFPSPALRVVSERYEHRTSMANLRATMFLNSGLGGTRPQAYMRPTLSPVAGLAPLVSRRGERRPTVVAVEGVLGDHRLNLFGEVFDDAGAFVLTASQRTTAARAAFEPVRFVFVNPLGFLPPVPQMTFLGPGLHAAFRRVGLGVPNPTPFVSLSRVFVVSKAVWLPP